MEINVQVEDRRASAWWKLFRIILVVSLVAYAWKHGYDLGQADMLNYLFQPAPQIDQNDMFTSL
jgi:hypothetical protein